MGMKTMMDYAQFLDLKSQLGSNDGFAPLWMPDFLYDFQAHLVDWELRKGRGALFEQCGLGKTPQQLVIAENVVRKTNKPALILTPLTVSAQTVREAEKFDIEVTRSRDGKPGKGITITNYQQLHKFNRHDFSLVVCDEGQILKNCDGTLRNHITQFMRKMPYRLLASATPSPNDYIELGTSSEALGYLGFVDMLNMFFKNDQNNSASKRMFGVAPKWRFKGHAERRFWQWVCSWARAIRKPSDIGFDDTRFILPDLIENDHYVEVNEAPPGMLFALPAFGLRDQRVETKRTIRERCEYAAGLVANTGKPAIIACNLNPEGDYLEKIIPDCVQISGGDRDEVKEEKLLAFLNGEARIMVSKHKIISLGINAQHCAHIVNFPNNSYEQYYQLVRRCHRFGQKNQVVVDNVLTEGERKIRENQTYKAENADRMFENLVSEMNNSISVRKTNNFNASQEIPAWL